MFGHKNKKDDGNVVILKKTGPFVCGGTDATLDKSAPKVIASREMTLFDVSCSFYGVVLPDGSREKPLHWFHAFAAPTGEGSFLFLKTSRRYSDEYSSAWAYVKEDVFPALVDLVNDVDLAEKNGYHSTTHGLPQNFGGSVNVRYASGEAISFSDNQSPIMSISVANKIADLLEKAMEGEKIVLPDVKDLAEIRFTELRSGGGFTKATLTLNGDGAGVNKKQSRYDDPKVYESEKPVDAATVAAIKSNISENGMLAWAGLPESGYFKTSEKSLTFVFKDGREITVGGAAALPGELGGGFFKIELELTAKN